MTEPFRVAIVYDVHGNAAALESVLADLATVPHDAVVVAGDLALLGPRPVEALAAVRNLGVPTIYGNTDRTLVHAVAPADVDPLVAWVRERIGDDGLAYLAGLPFEHRITPPGGASPEDDLLVVHATPTDVEAVLTLEDAPGAIWPVTPEVEAAALVGDARAGLIVFGHIHFASAGKVRGQRLVSVGSVGFPIDGDPRAAYAMASWDGGEWRVEHRRIRYDHGAVVDEVLRLGAPYAEVIARRVVEARFLPLP